MFSTPHTEQLWGSVCLPRKMEPWTRALLQRVEDASESVFNAIWRGPSRWTQPRFGGTREGVRSQVPSCAGSQGIQEHLF